MTAEISNMQRWMNWLGADHSPAELEKQLADDVVFISPVLHRPQAGKIMTMGYLLAAGQTLFNDSFRYVRTFDCGNRAVLEFETEMDGIHVNGVDIIEWNEDGKITEFKVMVRPLKGMQVVQEQMAKMLEQMKAMMPQK